MRTRTFIGLIMLVAALIVASTPALLEPTAKGVERLGVEAGFVEDQKALAKERAAAQKKAQKESGAADEKLELKGFAVEEDGDLRDTKEVGARNANERGRLPAGNQRVLLPGQKPGTDAYSPPFAAEDGVLLDIDGCPTFRPEADVAAMMADEDTRTKYANKVASADDAAACETVLNERIAIATASNEDINLPGDRRHYASMARSDSERMFLEYRRISMLADVLGMTNEQREDMIRELKGTPPASTSITSADNTRSTATKPATNSTK